MTAHNNPTPTPAPAPAAPASTPTPPASGGATNAPASRATLAGHEAIQGTIVTAFEAVRQDVAKWLLDFVPNAHLMGASKIIKILPMLAILFKIATPAGVVFDTMDDIAIDIARALNEEYTRRMAAAGTGTPVTTTIVTPTVPAQTPAPTPIDGRARFMMAARTTLNDPDFDDLIVWHRALSQDDQQRLDILAASGSNVQLEALVRQKPREIQKALSPIQLPPAPVKPKTFLQFRQEVAADPALTTLVSAFLKAKAVTPPRFWKAVEKAYGKEVKDKTDFEQLMNLGNDTVYQAFNLAPNVLEVFSTDLEANLNSSGLVKASDDAVARAMKRFKKAWK